MEIIKFYPRGFGANSYLLTADGKTAVIIDPCGEHVLQKAREKGLKIEYALLTHCHFDHVAGCAALQSQGVKIVCLDREKPLVGTTADLYELFHAPRELFSYTVDETVSDGEKRTFCGIEFTVLHTAGHTAGSTTFIVKNGEKTCLFTGDTLFENSIGRTDFPTGDMHEMQRSLEKLAALNGEVYAGHGEDTTMERERRENPFMGA